MELSEEEKKAIDLLNYYTGQYINCHVEDGGWDCCREEAEKILLNLIENQQREIETIYKVIDEMAVNISVAETFIAQNYGIYTEFDKADKEYIIKAFTNKAREYYTEFNKNKVKEDKE